MTKSTNPIIGYVTCPHCGNKEATVHNEKNGRRAKYYRCYGGAYGDCGTLQIRGDGGQKWINENMRHLGEKPPIASKPAVEAQKPTPIAVEATPAAEPEPEQKPAPEHKPKPRAAGVFDFLFSEGKA